MWLHMHGCLLLLMFIGILTAKEFTIHFLNRQPRFCFYRLISKRKAQIFTLQYRLPIDQVIFDFALESHPFSEELL